MTTKPPRLLRPANLIALILVCLSLGYSLAYFVSNWAGDRGRTGEDGSLAADSDLLAREPGPIRSLASASEPLNLGYLQQFCPAEPDPATPGLCHLEPEQAEALASQIPAEAVACWQQIYDYAFGPLADRAYFGGESADQSDPAGDGQADDDPPAEPVDCHQGVITVLVQPSFVSQIQADNRDQARFQDILFIMSAVIEHEAYRTRIPTNYSDIAASPILSYYRPEHINAPGTWNAQPAVAGAILSLSANPAGPDEIGVDPETGQLLLPTSGRWGDADQAGDPELLMIFHRADCRQGSGSPVALGGLRRYAVVYRPAGEDGFRCHGF